MTKSNVKKFLTNIQKEFTNIGAVITKNDDYKIALSLETKVGNLNLTIFKDQECMWAVYGRFDNIIAAQQVHNSNPWSGKYNNYSQELNPLDACKELIEIYKKLI